jgi:hypothetical protein
MFQDPDDGIIHEVFIQTLALRFGSVKIGSDLLCKEGVCGRTRTARNGLRELRPKG